MQSVSKLIFYFINVLVESHRDTLFVLTEHGGHLGFFTKTGRGSVDPHTWLERVIIQYSNALLSQLEAQRQGKKSVQRMFC